MGSSAARKVTEEAAMAASLASKLRHGLRDTLCANKPGKPTDYRVRVSASCVLRDGPAKQAAQQDDRLRKANATPAMVPTMAATRKEAAVLEREMAIAYPDKHARYDTVLDNGDMLHLSHLVLEKMMQPRTRILMPDPLERYNKLTQRLVGVVRKHGDTRLDIGAMQRHMILRATLAHLRATLNPPVTTHRRSS